ncbi:MAG: glycoside hydrolase family 1 protein [Anaerolineae bacterium]|nr:glycoside hydrolase family 1 protein [Anaerolineae bacterium]
MYDHPSPTSTDDILAFPAGFLWGTATSSHQVEGDNRNNQWWAWEQQPGRIWHGDTSGLACDWWRHAEADFDRAAALGQNSHRLSLEWSRIEPQEGVFDEAALARYRQMLQALHERGLEPMVTLHHFTNPLWLVELGEWENPQVVRYFERYTARVVEALGDLVTLWCTINEPAIYALLSYLWGRFPPGKTDWSIAFGVLANLLRGHAAAYHTIHRLRSEARVGLVKAVRGFEPANPVSPLDRLVTRLQDYFFNDVTLLAAKDGWLRFPLAWLPRRHGPLADSFDFVGVNYYTRGLVAFDIRRRREVFGRQGYRPGAALSDSGQFGPYSEIYPEGLYHVLRKVAMLGKPIIVTENGLPDADDDQRPRFLLTHLAQVHRALREGLPIEGYYHWSLVDNFEWAEGWGLRFGLIELDPQTQERRIRPSGHLYAEICRANGITREMARRYGVEEELFSNPPAARSAGHD